MVGIVALMVPEMSATVGIVVAAFLGKIPPGGAEWRMIFLDIIFLVSPDTRGLRPSQQEELAPKVLQRMGSDVLTFEL